MVKVDKYVRQLLFEHDFVIIPEFGGLLTHHVALHFDNETGSYHPASKRLAFNEILRFDDGLLSFWISSQENIPRDEATQIVRHYVDYLRNELNSGANLSIESIGSFSANTEGKLVFEPDYTQNFDPEWYGFTTVPVKLLSDEVLLENSDSEVSTRLSDSRRLAHTERKVVKSYSRLGWVAAAAMAAVVFAVSIESRPINHIMLSSVNPVAAFGSFFIRASDEENKPVKPFAYEGMTAVSANTSQKVQPDDFPSADEIEEPTASTPVENALALPVDRSHLRYHVIAGSFAKTKQAAQLVEKLKRIGFINATILKQPKSSWNMVAAESYESESVAYNHRYDVDSAIGVDSWVLKK